MKDTNVIEADHRFTPRPEHKQDRADDNARLLEQLKIAHERIQTLQERNEIFLAEVARERRESVEKNTAIQTTAPETNASLRSKLEDLVADVLEREGSLRATLQRRSTEVEKLSAQVARQKDIIHAETNAHVELRKEYHALELKFQQTEAEQTSLLRQLEALKADYTKLHNYAVRLKEMYKSLHERQNGLAKQSQAAMAELTQKLQEAQKHEQKSEFDRHASQHNLAATQAECAALRSEILALHQKLENKQKEVDALRRIFPVRI